MIPLSVFQLAAETGCGWLLRPWLESPATMTGGGLKHDHLGGGRP